MGSNFYVALVALVGSLAGALLSYRASTRANAIDAKKVDAEAYVRAAAIYEKALSAAEAELARMHSQTERVALQLESESDVSNALRGEVRIFRTRVDELERLVSTLRQSSDRVTRTPPHS